MRRLTVTWLGVGYSFYGPTLITTRQLPDQHTNPQHTQPSLHPPVCTTVGLTDVTEYKHSLWKPWRDDRLGVQPHCSPACGKSSKSNRREIVKSTAVYGRACFSKAGSIWLETRCLWDSHPPSYCKAGLPATTFPTASKTRSFDADKTSNHGKLVPLCSWHRLSPSVPCHSSPG